MTKEELALKLNGREYCEELTREEEREAKAAGLVVIFGASDDLCEFRGAVNKEIDCWDGGAFKLCLDGSFPFDSLDTECDESHREYCPCYQAWQREQMQKKMTTITAEWCKEDGYSWTIKADVPHATFDIMEDGDKYCRGIVIAIADIAAINAEQEGKAS